METVPTRPDGRKLKPLAEPLEPAVGAVAEHLRHCKRRNLRHSTIVQRQYALSRFRRWLHPGDMLKVDLDDLVAFLDRRMTPEARAVEGSHLKGFYRWAHMTGLISEDPTVNLIRPKIQRRLPRPIPTVELRRAIDEAPDHIRPMLMLASMCGLRACEIAGLRRQDVLDTQDPAVLVVLDGKGGKQRVIPMPDELVAEFRTWAVAPRGPVIPRRDGKLGHNEAWTICAHANKYLRGAQISHSLHTLRHWYGTAIYQASQDLRLTQELMGHASPVTTAGYAAWSPKAGVEVARGLTIDGVDL